jgi:molecular chaperone DnaJ
VTKGEPQNLNDAELKKCYLALAKKYHPDTKSGSTEKFQQVQAAFEKLSASKQGYTLTEEDLYDMY